MLRSDSQVEAEVSETELGFISGYDYIRFLSWKAGKLLAYSTFYFGLGSSAVSQSMPREGSGISTSQVSFQKTIWYSHCLLDGKTV